MDILDKLNDSQRQAVEYCDGPELVIAGAGSGKTRVLTHKIAYMLQRPDLNLAPWNILALTFTNKAADEMKQRVGQIVGVDVARKLNMGTFHSVFSRILRREAAYIGFSPNYTIYDETDSRSLVSSIIKDMKLDDTAYKPANIRHQISMAKNRLVSAAAYVNDSRAMAFDADNRIPYFYKIYETYEQRCRQSNVMDFDDLLFNTYRLFKDNEDVCRRYAEIFRYILVDEYQDTNYAQQCIVYQLSNVNRRLCVVGDDAQSIYAFRGANIDNILDFNKLYPEQKTFKLEQNYRSTQIIVEAANSLISHNSRQIHKDVFSRNEEGTPLKMCVCYTDRLEAMAVCNEIKRIRRQEGGEYDSFAVLYRTNAQSRCFEEEMRKQGIPYKIYGGLSFYQRKEVKDVLAYFRAAINPDDEEALRRIINYPARGIGATTLQKVSAAAAADGVSMWQVISDPAAHALKINRGTTAKLEGFAQLISSFLERAEITDAYVLGQRIIAESGIMSDLAADTTPEGKARKENIEELISELHGFVDTKREEDLEEETRLGNFMQEVALYTDKESDDDSESRVALMTIHAAKGLEFPNVFIVGLEENIFPGRQAMDSPRMMEEERRLMYVAITRAERHCMLTCAKTRFRYGHMEYDIPSRFIKDIDPRYISKVDGGEADFSDGSYGGGWQRQQRAVTSDTYRSASSAQSGFSSAPQTFKPRVSAAPATDAKPRRSMLRMASAPVARVESCTSYTDGSRTIHVGSVINHQRFGKGEIVKIEGKGENAKATVKFDLAGQKQLLLKFARYEVVKM